MMMVMTTMTMISFGSAIEKEFQRIFGTDTSMLPPDCGPHGFGRACTLPEVSVVSSCTLPEVSVVSSFTLPEVNVVSSCTLPEVSDMSACTLPKVSDVSA